MNGRRYSCEEVFSRLDDFLDRELGEEEMRLVQEHLDACAQCAAEHRFEARVLDGIRSKLRQLKVPDLLVKRVARIVEAEKQKPA